MAGSVILSDVSTTNKERETFENETDIDHVYEIVDNYNHAYENVKISPTAKPMPETQLQPLPSTGDYELTQCPAYVTMATTSIHGSTNKPFMID